MQFSRRDLFYSAIATFSSLFNNRSGHPFLPHMLDLSYHRLGVKLYCVNRPVRRPIQRPCKVLVRSITRTSHAPHCPSADACTRHSSFSFASARLPMVPFAAVVSTGDVNSVLPTVAVQGPHCARQSACSPPTMPARMHRGENCFKATLTGLPLYAHVPCPKGGAVTASESGSWLMNEAYIIAFVSSRATIRNSSMAVRCWSSAWQGRDQISRASRNHPPAHGALCLTAYDGAANIHTRLGPSRGPHLYRQPAARKRV